MGKLEELIDKRETASKRAAAAAEKAREEKAEHDRRQHRLWVRKEFNTLFKRLKTLVEGHWDKYGWGWKFLYKDKEYYISYDHWHYSKTPGDVDDYDMSGYHWVLKNHFNASSGDNGAITLGERSDHDGEKKDFTEAVIAGLSELNRRGGSWNERPRR